MAKLLITATFSIEAEMHLSDLKGEVDDAIQALHSQLDEIGDIGKGIHYTITEQTE